MRGIVDIVSRLTDATMTPPPPSSTVIPRSSPALSPPLSLLLTKQTYQKKVFFFVCLFCLQLVSLRWMRLHLGELMEAITSCLLLTVNSRCFGSGSNLIHNWKWLLRSIWYAFVLLTSATQAPPGGCSCGIWFFFFFPSVSFFPLHLFIFLSFDAFSRWQFTLQLRLL